MVRKWLPVFAPVRSLARAVFPIQTTYQRKPASYRLTPWRSPSEQPVRVRCRRSERKLRARHTPSRQPFRVTPAPRLTNPTARLRAELVKILPRERKT